MSIPAFRSANNSSVKPNTSSQRTRLNDHIRAFILQSQNPETQHQLKEIVQEMIDAIDIDGQYEEFNYHKAISNIEDQWMDTVTIGPLSDGKFYETKVWSQRRKEYDASQHRYEFWFEILQEIDGVVWRRRVWGREKEEESLNSDDDRDAFEVESDC